MDCEDCRHLTVVGLQDTGPRSLISSDEKLKGILGYFLTSSIVTDALLGLSICHAIGAGGSDGGAGGGDGDGGVGGCQ